MKHEGREVACVADLGAEPGARVDDPVSPSHKLSALLLPAQVITQANVQDVIDAGALTAEEICKGIESDCQALGIS